MKLNRSLVFEIFYNKIQNLNIIQFKNIFKFDVNKK